MDICRGLYNIVILKQTYRTLNTKIIVKKKRTEI